MGDLVKGAVGPVNYDVAFVAGKLQISGVFGVDGVAVNLVVGLDPSPLLDKLAALIPGKIDDAIIAALKAALAAQ